MTMLGEFYEKMKQKELKEAKAKLLVKTLENFAHNGNMTIRDAFRLAGVKFSSYRSAKKLLSKAAMASAPA